MQVEGMQGGHCCACRTLVMARRVTGGPSDAGTLGGS